MRLPGFTAEVTLFKTDEPYRLIYDPAGAAPSFGIQPQGCSPWEWVGCAAAIAGCASACVISPGPQCILACVAIVAAGCLKCAL